MSESESTDRALVATRMQEVQTDRTSLRCDCPVSLFLSLPVSLRLVFTRAKNRLPPYILSSITLPFSLGNEQLNKQTPGIVDRIKKELL